MIQQTMIQNQSMIEQFSDRISTLKKHQKAFKEVIDFVKVCLIPKDDEEDLLNLLLKKVEYLESEEEILRQDIGIIEARIRGIKIEQKLKTDNDIFGELQEGFCN